MAEKEERSEPEGTVLESSERVRSGADRTTTGGALDRTVAATPRTRERAAERHQLESAQTTQRSSGFSEQDMLGATQLVGSESSPAVPASADDSRATLDPFAPYTRIEILDEQGSIGLVARGYNEAFGRWELLKFLREEFEEDNEAVRQFKREGKVLAQLSHPNVVQVFATYDVEGRTCLAMEYLHGQSLAAHVAESGGALGVDRAEELLLEATRGLAASHDAGLLHRDIKPDNLFVTAAGRGRIGGLKLIDFGLATADRSRRVSTAGDCSLVSGTLGGTPLFMAPELWAGQPATPASDLYALGITFYYALTGDYPFSAPTLAAIRQELSSGGRLPSVRKARPEVPSELAAIVDQAMALDPAERFASADEMVAAIVACASGREHRAVPSSGPYRGLEPYTAEERDVFFGRTREVTELTEKLRVQPAVVLVGPSGSGKSSLALAGVAPAVADGALGGSVVFQTLRVEPRLRPCRSLATKLAAALGADVEAVAGLLEREPQRLAESLLAGLGASRGLLLVVDQLEELATIALDAGDVLRFATAIDSLVESPAGQLKIVATLRADLMDRLFTVEPLRSLLTRAFYPVRPLLGEPLRRAIVEPARIAGFELEDPGVAAEIVEGVARTPAGLPLASFAMQAWWRERDEARRLLPTNAWQRLGGLAGALTSHADEVVDAMPPEERSAAEQILVRLVTEEGARSVAPRAELVDPSLTGTAGARALDRLLEAKLVVESATEIELVHEALAASWPRLRRLIESSGEDRAYRQRVVGGAREWDAHGRRTGTLWDGEEAQRLLDWFAKTDAPLGQLELAFVEAVRAHEARRRFYRRGLLLGAALVTLMLALIALARERRLAARLERATDTAGKVHESHVRETRRLLMRLARLEAPRDPGAAVTALLRARQLGPDDSLDPIAWRARISGVPRALPPHSGGVALVGIDPLGNRILSVGNHRKLHWLAVRGKSAGEAPLHGKSGRPTVLTFSSDGRHAAIGDAQGGITTVAFSRRGVGGADACSAPVTAVAWTQGERVVALCGPAGGRVRVVATELSKVTELVDAPASVAALGRDGRYLAFADAEQLVLTDLKTGNASGKLALKSPPTALALLSDDGKLVFADQRGQLAVVETKGESLEPSWLDAEPQPGIQRIAADPSGSGRFVAFGAQGRAWLFDAAHRSVGTLLVSESIAGWSSRDTGPSPKASTVALLSEHSVVIFDAENAAELGRVPARRVNEIALSERWMVLASGDGGARAFDITEVAGRGQGHLGEGRCAVSSDAINMACAQLFPEPQLVLRRLGRAERSFAVDSKWLPEEPRDLAVGPAGRHVAWLLPDGRLVHAKLSTKTVSDIGEVRSRVAHAATLFFAPDEPTLAVAAVKPRPALTVISDFSSAGSAVEHYPAAVTALAFQPQSARVVTGHVDGRVLSGGGKTQELSLGDTDILALTVSDDGGSIAAGDAAGRVAYRTGKATLEWLRRSGKAVACLAWSRGGRALVLGTRAGEVVMFEVESGDDIPVMQLPEAIGSCVREPSADRFVFVTESGELYQRQLDLSPVWMQPPPTDPLDPAVTVGGWNGLLGEPEQ